MSSYFPYYGPDGRPLPPPQPVPTAPVDPRWLAQSQTAPPPYAGFVNGAHPQGYVTGAQPAYGVPPPPQPPYADFGYSMPPQGHMPGPQPAYGAPPHTQSPYASSGYGMPPQGYMPEPQPAYGVYQHSTLPYRTQPAVHPTSRSIRAGREALVSQEHTYDGDEDESKDEPKKPEVKTYAQVSTSFPELSLAERVDLLKEPLTFPMEKQAADRKKDAPHRRKVEELMKKSKGAWHFKPNKQYACTPDNGRAFTVRLPYTKGATCKKCNKADHTEDQHGKFTLHFFDRAPPPGPLSKSKKPEPDSPKKTQPQDAPRAGSSEGKTAAVIKGYDKVDELLLKHYRVQHAGLWRVLKSFQDTLADVEKSAVSAQSAKAKADAEVDRNRIEDKIRRLYINHSRLCDWMPEVTQPTADDPVELSEEDESKGRLNALDWSKDEDTRVVQTLDSFQEMWKTHAANYGDPDLPFSIPQFDPADLCLTDEPAGKSEAKYQLMAWRDDWHHDPENSKFKSWDQARVRTVQSCCEAVTQVATNIQHDSARLVNDVKRKIMEWEQTHQSLHALLPQLRQKCKTALIDVEKCRKGENMRSKNVVTSFVRMLLEDMQFFDGIYEHELTKLQGQITTAIDRAVTAKAQAEEVADGVEGEGIKEYREELLASVCAPVLEQLRRIKPQLSRALWFIPRLEYCDFGPDIMTSLNVLEAPVEVEVP